MSEIPKREEAPARKNAYSIVRWEAKSLSTNCCVRGDGRKIVSQSFYGTGR